MSVVDSSGYPVLNAPNPSPAPQSQTQTQNPAQPLQPWLMAEYKPHPGAWDEAVDDRGQIRPHYQKVFNLLEKLGPQELARRSDRARQAIEESGISYIDYRDPQGVERPWDMDILPLVLAGKDWDELSKGLRQRALLLNLILEDIHGPMRLLREGWIPPELVWANPNFLRAAHGHKPAGDRYLHFHSVDLARGPAGGWWVIGDRTQAPTGAGYALSNRLISNRILSEEYRSLRVERLANYFQALRAGLASIAPRNKDNPRVCLLTPGPYNEVYFEHTFLARYLGLTLVEGGDLTKRNNRLFLKTLAGLQPVDVLLRRLDDGTADPLELRPDSTLGVPGLTLAAINGQVAVANPLGSGVVETAGLMAFLPGLCRHLLQQELLIPSVATWWCGEPEVLRFVEEHLHELVLKPAFPGTGLQPIFCETLSKEEIRDLIQRIRRRPHAWVAQEPVQLATAPALVQRKVQPLRFMLRTFTTAVQQDQSESSYQVLPGGLTRVSTLSDDRIVSIQHGLGSSKDTWVLAEKAVPHVTLLRQEGAPIQLRRGGPDLFSRIADNMYWLGRYVERAEGATRLLRVVLRTATSELSTMGMAALPSLLASMSYYGIDVRARFDPAALNSLATPARGIPTIETPNPTNTQEPSAQLPLTKPHPWASASQRFESDLTELMLGKGRPGNLRNTMGNLRRTSRLVRDRLSIDTARVLTRLDNEFRALLQPNQTQQDITPRLDEIILQLAAFSGLGMESTTRSPGWRFLDLGRRVERAIHTVNLLSTTLVFPPPPTVEEQTVLQALLDICDSSMTYRSRYLAVLDPVAVLDLLLTDESNPRSVAFQALAIHDHVANLPRDATRATLLRDERLALTILNDLRLAAPHALMEIDPNFHAPTSSPNSLGIGDTGSRGGRPHLDDYLDRLLVALPALNDALTMTYLSGSNPAPLHHRPHNDPPNPA